MRHTSDPRAGKTRFLALTAAGASLLAIQMPLAAQQGLLAPSTPPSVPSSIITLPQPARATAPVESRLRGPDGKLFDRSRRTVYSPGYKQLTPAPLVLNKGMGGEGVKEGQRIVLPFGSKGERVGLSFSNGTYLPPAGERIQPALAGLAQARVAAEGGLAGGAVSPSVFGMILLNGRYDDGTRAALNGLGVQVTGFYPETGLLARIPVSSLKAVANLSTVRWVGQPNAAQKVQPALVKRMAKASDAAPLHVWISFFADDKIGTMQADVAATGVKLGRYDKGLAVVEALATPAQIRAITGLDHVFFVEAIGEMKTMNELGTQAMNADWLWGSLDPNDGSTQIKVGILDTGCYSAHTDFSNVAGGMAGYSLITGENWYDDLHGHGTHVSGTIIGEGNANYRYRGIADRLTSHGAPTTSTDYLVGQVLDQTGHGSFSTFVTGVDLFDSGSGIPGIKRQVWNASLGGGTNAPGTSTECRKVDETFGNGVLPCIAAGNAGPGASTIGSPGAAKGAFTVGSVYNNTEAGSVTDNLTPYSSRGPTGDSTHPRNKPDVVATGSYVDSLAHGTTNGYYYDWEGTSMATPHVTGIAAGMIAHYPGFPAWAIKSAMCASAVDLGYTRNEQGVGKVDAMLSHYTIDGGWTTWWSTIGGTGSIQYVDFVLDHAVAQLRVVNCYPDPPCAAGATDALVNDLDMRVQYSADGTGLTTDLAYNAGSDLGYNTLSMVVINNAPAGHYRFKLNSFNVPTGSQAWALTCKVVDSKLYPTLNTSFTTPYAIRPNTGFYAMAAATPDAHSATGIVGSISMSSGMQIDGALMWRMFNGGYESIWNPAPGGPAYYELNHLNMGAAAAGYTRYLYWWLEGTTEGHKTVTYTASSRNASPGSTTVSNDVIVDGTAPTIGTAEGRNWTQALHCDVVIPVQDTLAGINPSTGWYRYSTDGGANWSAWTNVGTSGGYGSTGVQTITALDVPFNQNNANNMVQGYVQDTAGNETYSTSMVVTTPIVTGLALSPATVPGGNNVTGTITLSGNAPTGGAAVAVTNTNPKASAPPTVVVPGGTNTASFTITTVGVTSTYSGKVTASYGGASVASTLKVRPVNILTHVLAPSKIVGGSVNATGTVTLDALAPVNTTVTLVSNNPAIGSVPASIVIPAGSTTGTYTLTSSLVSSDTIVTVTGKCNGVSKAAKVTVTPVHMASIVMSPTSIVGGWDTSTGTITLDANAPSNTTITLSSNNPGVGQVPPSITIPAGSISGTFTMKSSLVSASTTVTISATLGANTLTAKVTVKQNVISSFRLNPTSVTPGGPGHDSTGTVTLSGKAPAAGLVVSLSSNNAGVAYPATATITIAGGSLSGTCTIHTNHPAATTTVGITATANGSTKTASLKVNP